MTGVTFTTVDVISKQLSQLHDLAPKAELIGVLLDPNDMEVEVQLREAEAAAAAIGRGLFGVKAASPSEFNAAFASIVQAGIGALLVGGGPYFTSQRQRLALLSARHAIPTSYTEREFALAGGLMSYGPSRPMHIAAPVAMPLGSSRARGGRPAGRSGHQGRAGHQSRNCGDARNCHSERATGVPSSNSRGGPLPPWP